MQTNFEYAYYLFLTGGHYRPHMIACGVDALLNGLQGEYLTFLAGASKDEESELLVQFFRKAAKETGVYLPSKREEELWHLTKYYQFEPLPKPMAQEDLRDRLNRNLLFIHLQLSQLKQSQEAQTFIEHFGRYPREKIGHYVEWHKRLAGYRDVVMKSDAPVVLKHIISEITGIINSFSYGAIANKDVDRSQALVDSLITQAPFAASIDQAPRSGRHTSLNGPVTSG